MNKPVEDIDIFQRTLKCKDLPLEEPEIEIFEIESEEKLAEEEEIIEEPETEIDPEVLYFELECLKRQIQKLLILLKNKSEPIPEPETTCEEEKEICNLQKVHHRMQCQIYELNHCFQFIKEELRKMHSFFCRQTKDVEQLWRITAFLKYWQSAMKPDEGVCHQRFVYLKNKKAEWMDVEGMIMQRSRCPEKLLKRYLSHEDFHANRIFLQAELEQLKHLFVELFEMKNPSFHDFWTLPRPVMPLKQIEIDFIQREIKKNKKLQNKSCKEYFKCDKIEWK